MAGCALAIERRLVVCARNDCWKCAPTEDMIPEDCEYEILHPLETFAGGLGIRPFGRRTGKTTRLVEVANYMAAFGHRVYFLTMTVDMGKHTKRNHKMDGSVMMVSQHQGEKLNSMAPGYVLADELLPAELDKIAVALSRHVLVACWYTPR